MATVDVLELQGMDNCRKVPGLKLFRSARPDEATSKDIKTLIFHDISAIIDFRDQSELKVQGSEPLVNAHYSMYNLVKDTFRAQSKATGSESGRGTGASITAVSKENCTSVADFRKHYFVPIAHCKAYRQALFRRAPASAQFQIAYYFLYDKACGTARTQLYAVQELVSPFGLLGLYKDLIRHCGAIIAAALNLLCNPSNACALLCCSFGKDRTGIVVALVRHVCGHSKEDICADYARTTEMIEASSRMQERAKTEFASFSNPSFGAAEYNTMNDLIDFINDKYGSIEEYLDSIQFDKSRRELLRENLME